MFIEGIFLYSKVSRNVFSSSAPFHLYYMIGWGGYWVVMSVIKVKNVVTLSMSYQTFMSKGGTFFIAITTGEIDRKLDQPLIE